MHLNPPPYDAAKADAATLALYAEGYRQFQTHFWAADPAEHAARLLDWMQPPVGALVVDMGCGVGEVARLMREARPDLSFVLVDISRVKLERCPLGSGFYRLLADGHDTRLPGGEADVVMFNSALINMDAGPALAEAARLVKPGGMVFVNELVRLTGDNRRFEEVLGARAPTESELRHHGMAAGLFCSRGPLVMPAIDLDFRSRLMSIGEVALLDEVQPQVWRFIRG
jgi:SAM-dependent methyltransferase